jgi:hypothetical protein
MLRDCAVGSSTPIVLFACGLVRVSSAPIILRNFSFISAMRGWEQRKACKIRVQFQNTVVEAYFNALSTQRAVIDSMRFGPENINESMDRRFANR